MTAELSVNCGLLRLGTLQPSLVMKLTLSGVELGFFESFFYLWNYLWNLDQKRQVSSEIFCLIEQKLYFESTWDHFFLLKVT